MATGTDEVHRAWDGPPMYEPRSLRFVMSGGLLPVWPLRALYVALSLAALAPAIWAFVVALTVASDRAFVVVGIIFSIGAVAILVGNTRIVHEVAVIGDQLTWRSAVSQHSARLSDLRAVQPARWPKVGTTFKVMGKPGFEVLPAEGSGAFLQAMGEIRPDLRIRVPPAVRGGRFVYGRASVILDGRKLT